MSNLNIMECKGCCSDFAGDDLSVDNYCESCQYEHDANQDHLSDEQFNHE